MTVRPQYILTLLITGLLVYFFYPEKEEAQRQPKSISQAKPVQKEVHGEEPPPKDFKQVQKSQEKKEKPRKASPETIKPKKTLTLFEKVTGVDEINRIKKLVLDFEAPEGEEVDRQTLNDGSDYVQYRVGDHAIVNQKTRLNGSSIYNYISKDLRLSRFKNSNGGLDRFHYNNLESGDSLAIQYNQTGQVIQRIQAIDGLWFHQEFDEKGKPIRQEVIDYETDEAVSFDYYFKLNK